VDAQTLDYARDYEAAWDLYAARDFAAAAREFGALVQRRPQDMAATVLLACLPAASPRSPPGRNGRRSPSSP
jgi:hypothetical protein